MNEVLVIGQHDGNSLNPVIARCVTCAKCIPDARITIVLFGADTAAVASQAAALSGVDSVVRIDRVENAVPLAAVLAPQVAALAGDYTHVLGPSTSFGKDLTPRVAALLGVPQISDVMAVETAYRFRRPIYAGNLIATVEADPGRKLVATVRSASFEGVGTDGHAEIRTEALSVPIPTHSRYIDAKAVVSDRPDLQTAKRVISGGRGLGSAENFRMLFDLADKIGAAVGASRAAVDAGFVASEMQVGQTGKIIAPELYFAVGISGAIQHLTGIKDARTIVAINKDSEAPIFEVADVGLVGDLFQIVPELERLVVKS